MLVSGIAITLAVLVLAAGGVLGYRAYSRWKQERALRMRDDADEGYADVALVMKPRGPTVIEQPVARPVALERPVTKPGRREQVVQVHPRATFTAVRGGTEVDEPVQLLPGRLEPLDSGVQQEIRFIRRPGVDRFTLGRSSGPANSHIQLSAATASRMHAYMRLDGSRWRIGNLSETNPLTVNGTPLREGERALENGDRIEIGELVFVFRDR